ncbi:MAG TPA: 50S ribosomal protein L17 [Candidatus Krumholzibacteria bacterium]|jgi:large subunit ribosomal protein L17|nr:50S ribosomal protein L17 [Candidatus Krumholzibacteria bacterium]
MRHRKSVAKLGRTQAHRRAMLRNMVTSLLRHERIRTTAPKAKVARRYAERMITLGKRGDLHARRQAATFIIDETVLKKLFDELAPKFEERKGGYTRLMRTGLRKGDGADMAILELVTQSEPRKKKGNRKTSAHLAPFKTGEAGKGKRKRAAKKPTKASPKASKDAGEGAAAGA